MATTVGEEAERRFTAQAAAAIRGAIADAGGREVFFAGSLNSRGLVESVRVCARGTEGAVPAIFEGLRLREVVIHNHPSGTIAPSEADLQLAVHFGNNGHGVYITDNEAERVYIVVEPFLDTEIERLDPAELGDALAPGGMVATVLSAFEVRPQQRAMMEAVARAFNHDGMAVVEAPTGVGKTIAYLLPAVMWARKNRERVVVSTRTINLQEQVVHKDIPLLNRCFDRPVQAALVKGRGNYLCQRKLQRAVGEATLFDDDEDAAALKAIAEWADKTTDGSLSDLSFVPGREVWNKVCSESDICSAGNCPNAEKCFVGRARREIAKADVLVVNHHMLFADLNIKEELGSFTAPAVLPAYHRVIFDEAHNIEESATEHFGMDAARLGLLALLGRFLRSERGRDRGLLPFLKTNLIREAIRFPGHDINAIIEMMDTALQPALVAARDGGTAAFDALRAWALNQVDGDGRESRLRLTDALLADEGLREIHRVYVATACEDFERCAQLCVHLYDALRKLGVPQDATESPFMTEILQLDSYGARLRRLSAALRESTGPKLAENTVRWIEVDPGNPKTVRVARRPLEVGKPLADWVYGNLKTVVMTSATLTVDQRFDYFATRTGIDRVPESRIETAQLDTPFAYDEQALLGVVNDLPSPEERGFLEPCAEAIAEAIEITGGSAFVLFTSYYALDYTHRRVQGALRSLGIRALKQGEASRSQLLEQFRHDTSSVLFATDSFWEGVDVAGDSLRCVIVPRLPFRVPTEPIQQARAEAITAAGGNAFMEYTVPQAVIKFRQGFGRLIRRRSDHGAILVLDRRLVTKHYGNMFLHSLPGVRVVRGPKPAVFQAMRKFFDATSFSMRKGKPHERPDQS